MADPTLGNVLAYRYNIKENLLAEGKFIAHFGVDRKAVGLIGLGISDRCLVSARLMLGGDDVDFELLAVTPLSLLTVSVHNYPQKKIIVHSQFKSPQLFQLCSSEDQDDIWASFVDGIWITNANSQYDSWSSASIESIGSETKLSKIPRSEFVNSLYDAWSSASTESVGSDKIVSRSPDSRFVNSEYITVSSASVESVGSDTNLSEIPQSEFVKFNSQYITVSSASVESVDSDTTLYRSPHSEFEHESSLLSKFYPWTSYTNLQSLTDTDSNTQRNASISKTSLPESLDSTKDEFQYKCQTMAQRRHSNAFGEKKVGLESVLNDVPTRLSEENRTHDMCLWNDSTDDMFQISSERSAYSLTERNKIYECRTGSNRFFKALKSRF